MMLLCARGSVLAVLFVCIHGHEHHGIDSQSERVCSGYPYSVSCPTNSFFAVESAEYGRRQGDRQCGTRDDTSWYNDRCIPSIRPVTGLIHYLCFMRNPCRLSVRDRSLLDAEQCANTRNYLTIKSFCVPVNEFTTVCNGETQVINHEKGYIASRGFPENLPTQNCRVVIPSLAGKTRLYLRLLYVSPTYMAHCGSTLVFSSSRQVSLNGGVCQAAVPPTSLNLTLPVVLEMRSLRNVGIARGFFVYFEKLGLDDSLSTTELQPAAPPFQDRTYVRLMPTRSIRAMIETTTFDFVTKVSTLPELQANKALGKEKKVVISVAVAVLVVVIITLVVVVYIILKAWMRTKASSKTNDAVLNLRSRPPVDNNQYGTPPALTTDMRTPARLSENAERDVMTASSDGVVGRPPVLIEDSSRISIADREDTDSSRISMDDLQDNIDGLTPGSRAPSPTFPSVESSSRPRPEGATETDGNEPSVPPSESERVYYNTLPTGRNIRTKSIIRKEDEDDDYEDRYDFEVPPDLTAIRAIRTSGLSELTGPATGERGGQHAEERQIKENDIYDTSL